MVGYRGEVVEKVVSFIDLSACIRASARVTSYSAGNLW